LSQHLTYTPAVYSIAFVHCKEKQDNIDCRDNETPPLSPEQPQHLLRQVLTPEFSTTPTPVIPTKVTEGNALGCRNPEPRLWQRWMLVFQVSYLLDQINDPDVFEFISALRIEVIGPERINK